MKILWTWQALTKLRAIKFYIEDKSSGTVARDFIKKLIEKADTLLKFPAIGCIVSELNSPNIRELIEDNYRIIYCLGQDEIEILTIFEGRKLLQRGEIDKVAHH